MSVGISPASVFESLNLGTRNVLTNPSLNTWVKYMDDFNARYPTEKTTMIDTITVQLGDEGLATILERAMKVANTKAFATKLQT